MGDLVPWLCPEEQERSAKVLEDDDGHRTAAETREGGDNGPWVQSAGRGGDEAAARALDLPP